MTTFTDIGLYLDTHNWGGSFEAATRLLQQIQPNWSLLLHGGESARVRPFSPRTKWIQRESGYDTAAIVLKYDENHKANPKFQSAESYCNRRFPQVPEGDYILPINEIPSLKNPEHAKWWVEWMLSFGRKIVSAGRKGAIGVIPLTTLEKTHWQPLMPVLDYISKHSDQLVFCFTGYSNGFMASGVNGTYPPHFKDKDGKEYPSDKWYKFSPHEWPKAVDPTLRQFIAGRIWDMALACKDAGVDSPPSVCVEDGLDTIDDSVKIQWTEYLLKRPGYGECKGWRSMQTQNEAWIKTFPPPYNTLKWQQYHLYGRLWQRDVVYRPLRRSNGDCVVESSLDFLATTNPEWEAHFNTMSEEMNPFWDGYLADRQTPKELPWRVVGVPSPAPLPQPPPTPPPPDYPPLPIPYANWTRAVNESGQDVRLHKPGPGPQYPEVGVIVVGAAFDYIVGSEYKNYIQVKSTLGTIGWADKLVLSKKLPEPPNGTKGSFMLELKIENVTEAEAKNVADVLADWLAMSISTFAVVKATGAKIEMQVKPLLGGIG